MPHLRPLLARLRLPPGRDLEIVEELAQHLDDRYQELRGSGVADADAQRIALQELRDAGGLTPRLEALAQANLPPPITTGHADRTGLRGIWQDVRYAARSLGRQRMFAGVIVATLALGIAVNATVFTIVNAVALRPLPFPDGDRLVFVDMLNARNQQTGLSYLDYVDLQRAAPRTLEGIGAVFDGGADIADDRAAPARIDVAYVSWNLFSVLGEVPARGRDFVAADDRSGAPPVVIISGNLWRARYGADPAIIGSTIRVAGVPSTVVGVMPPEFGFPDREALWLPLAALPERMRTSRSERFLDGIGRLRLEATMEQAVAELTAATASIAATPGTNRIAGPAVRPLGIGGDFLPVLVALVGAVGFVLLIACANVANLLLARAADRSRDVTLRLALGASRWRIVRQLLVEGLLLAAAGGILGVILAQPGLAVFRNLPPESAPPSWVRFTIDYVVLGYIVALCVGSAVVCSLAPAWHVFRLSLTVSLNDAGRASTGGRQRRRWTGAVVVAQVALSIVLLAGATLMMQNLMSMVRLDLGIDTRGLSQMSVDLRRPDYTAERRLAFFAALEERLAAQTGVDAALVSDPPLGWGFPRRVQREGEAPADPASLPFVSWLRTGRRYFDVVGVRVIAGRTFNADDWRQPEDHVVVNERFARMYLSEGSAVGSRIRLTDPGARQPADAPRWATVVGVVSNVMQRVEAGGTFSPVVYSPYAADPPQTMQVLVRQPSRPAAAVAAVNDHVQALDRDLPLFGTGSVDEVLAQGRWPQRIFGSMFAIFAGIAVCLAACGLYAVTAYAVSRRTREMGVRVALGADARRIWWAATGTTLRQLIVGIVIGVAGAAAVSRVLPGMLVGTGAASAVAIGGVALLLLAVGLVAGTVPARRAIRVDPVTVLQAE